MMSNSNFKPFLVLICWTIFSIFIGIFISIIFGILTLDLTNVDYSYFGYVIGICGVLGGIYSVHLQNKYQKIHLLEENLRSERRKIYLKLLEPQILLFSNLNSKLKDSSEKETILKENQEKINKIMYSQDYTQNNFEYVIFGSDEAIIAYNNFMQYLYKNSDNSDSKEVFNLMANVVLAVRKDVGVKDTKLGPFDLFKWKITDIDQYTNKDEK